MTEGAAAMGTMAVAGVACGSRSLVQSSHSSCVSTVWWTFLAPSFTHCLLTAYFTWSCFSAVCK